MAKKDDRTAEERAEWESGKFTASEAKAMGMTAAEANAQREIDERELGNQFAPPE